MPSSVDGRTGAFVTRREFGPLNAQRLPPYHRLDVRATRRFGVGRGDLEVYVDVFNLYNRENLRGYLYSLDAASGGHFTTRRSDGEEMMPILPTLGFRWVF